MSKAVLLRMRELIQKMSLEEKAALCSGADFWHTEAVARVGINAVEMADGPHGVRRESDAQNYILGDSEPATCFPTAAALACSFDRALLREVGGALAREARGKNISMLLGPGINIKRSPLCGRNFEYFSEDPFLSGELAAAYVSGMQAEGVSACLKHYAANNQENKRMVSDSCVDNRALHELYLEAFRIAIEKSRPHAVMSSYNKVNGAYVGEDPYLLKEVLRGRFGFDGIVVSDWGGVNDRVAAIKAGLDLEMPGKTSGTTQDIVRAVESGELDEQDLDVCVARILAFVTRARNTVGACAPADAELHHRLARRAAADSTVLLKNDGGLLPFADNKPFAVIGRMAMQPRYQGTGSSRIVPTQLPSVLDELEARGTACPYSDGYNEDGSTNDILVGDAKQIAMEAGRAVIFVGLPERYESEGFDRAHMGLPEGMLKLIDVVCAACPDTVVYLMLGSPVALPFAARARAIVCGYLGGQAAGQAAVDVLTGRANPGGRLAETWPVKLADVPCANYYSKNRKSAEYREGIYVGYRYYSAAGVQPLYAFGHGLSYTTFEVDGVSCSCRTLGANEQATVTARVSNTGERDGYAVLQLYVKKSDDDMQQLKAFEKVHLYAGESRIVSFALHTQDFFYHDGETDTRRVEMGDYIVSVGASANEIYDTIPITVFSDDPHDKPATIAAPQAPDVDDEAFYELLGYTPKEPARKPFTLNSTLNELRTRTIGKILYHAFETNYGTGGRDAATAAMLEKTVGDMPLRALCALSKGALSKSKALAIVSFANNKPLRGILYAIKK